MKIPISSSLFSPNLYQFSMNPMISISLLFTIYLLPFISGACNHTCNSGRSSKHFPYPFGFTAGCPIQLNCTRNGNVKIAEFPVQSVTPNGIKLTIGEKCDRPINNIRPLFGRNYAPTKLNAFLLENCSSPVGCTIPNTTLQTTFQSCSNNSVMNCYYQNETEFIELEKVDRSGCQFLVSAISGGDDSNSPLSLDVQVVKLEWWIDGNCNCSENADCDRFLSPVSNFGAFRCRCRDGFDGDGFAAGIGCRKVTHECNAAKYISGQCGGKARIGILAAGVAVGALIMIGIGLIGCILRRQSNLKTKNNTNLQLCKSTDITIPIHPYKEIQKATNNFSDQQTLGAGAYGTVYAGKLQNAKWVAIKRLKNRDSETIEKFINEIKLISSVNHPNLVRLLGCSIENEQKILVYEFMPNGTLFQHLQQNRGDPLPWEIRLKIAVETAKAIAYLHFEMNPPIYHRDVKSSNILLDYNFNSKVADFGLSRLGVSEISHISTAPQGTPGYLDPEYHQNFHLSDKSDVYSFGVVLVEMITALKVVDFSRPQNEVNLAGLATDRIGRGRLGEIVDPCIDFDGDEWTAATVNKVGELAFRCLAYGKDMRPTMVEVAGELEMIRERRWVECESEEMSSCFSLSNESEKVIVNNGSMDRMSENSPLSSSLRDSWLSEGSSPSSNSLLSNVIQ